MAGDAPGPDRKRSALIGTAADIAIHEGGALARRALERRLLGAGYTPRQVARIIAGKGYGRRLAASALARLSSRSLPGALLVGGGLLARAFMLGRSESRRAGEETPPAPPETEAGLD